MEATNRQLATQRLNLLFRTANALLLGSLGIVVVYLAARMILDNVFSVGLLIAFLAYMDMFLRRASGLIDTVVALRMLGLHAERLADIALTAPEPSSEPGSARRVPARIGIEARYVSFRYGPNDPFVLENVSFRIEPGESLAFVGPSGCGKNTLLKMLAGLLEPSSGQILVDGVPWRGSARRPGALESASSCRTTRCLRARWRTTSRSSPPMPTRTEDSARRAAVHDDIEAMPMGYGTLIGDMGTSLSGGQKQRVFLARALYREPSLLLLDEATSHLDVARERIVNDTLRGFSTTRIVVAHHPETIRAADRVIRLDGGRIASDGPPVPRPESLLAISPAKGATSLRATEA